MASLRYLPEQTGYKTRFSYEVCDDIIYQIGSVSSELGADPAFLCQSFDKNGTVLKNRKIKMTDDREPGSSIYVLRDGKIISDALIAYSDDGRWNDRHLSLWDADQTNVLAEADNTFIGSGRGSYPETEQYCCQIQIRYPVAAGRFTFMRIYQKMKSVHIFNINTIYIPS